MVKPFKFHALLSVSFERFCTLFFFFPLKLFYRRNYFYELIFIIILQAEWYALFFQQDEKKCTQWKVYC